jgi:uncharacterized protein YjbJ (UPF0337 family)
MRPALTALWVGLLQAAVPPTAQTLPKVDRSRLGRNSKPGVNDMGINKDQVEGRAKEAAGKVQETAGRAVGSAGQQAKGLGKQAEGAVQSKYGDAKETIKDHAKDADKRP